MRVGWSPGLWQPHRSLTTMCLDSSQKCRFDCRPDYGTSTSTFKHGLQLGAERHRVRTWHSMRSTVHLNAAPAPETLMSQGSPAMQERQHHLLYAAPGASVNMAWFVLQFLYMPVGPSRNLMMGTRACRMVST